VFRFDPLFIGVLTDIELLNSVCGKLYGDIFKFNDTGSDATLA
jgi:hypothetical protein